MRHSLRHTRSFPLHRAPADHNADIGQRLADLVAGVALGLQTVNLARERAHLADVAARWMLGLEVHGVSEGADRLLVPRQRASAMTSDRKSSLRLELAQLGAG